MLSAIRRLYFFATVTRPAPSALRRELLPGSGAVGPDNARPGIKLSRRPHQAS
jgi:hypothetical protein